MVRRVAVRRHRNGTGGGANNMANSYLDVRPEEVYRSSYAGKGLMRQFYLRIPHGDLPDAPGSEWAIARRSRRSR
jgi:hypothetical protein